MLLLRPVSSVGTVRPSAYERQGSAAPLSAHLLPAVGVERVAIMLLLRLLAALVRAMEREKEEEKEKKNTARVRCYFGRRALSTSVLAGQAPAQTAHAGRASESESACQKQHARRVGRM